MRPAALPQALREPPASDFAVFTAPPMAETAAAPHPQRRRRFAAQSLAALLSALVMLAALAVPARAEAPFAGTQDSARAGFDFYVLSLSWSPTYCEAQGPRAVNEPQCALSRPFAFVVHGLWPQHERGYPEYCERPAPYVSNALVNSMLDIMPSKGLVIHEWKRHGTCSGLDAQGYFGTVRAARKKVAVPAEFIHLDDYRMVSPQELEAAFLTANPGLQSNMISVDCDKRRLREVRICLSRDLAFRPCPDVDRRSCRLQKMVMPPVRGN